MEKKCGKKLARCFNLCGFGMTLCLETQNFRLFARFYRWLVVSLEDAPTPGAW